MDHSALSLTDNADAQTVDSDDIIMPPHLLMPADLSGDIVDQLDTKISLPKVQHQFSLTTMPR